MPDSSPTLIPADGWWAIYRREGGDTYRSRVVAFGTATDAAGDEGLRAWLAGDMGWLESADHRVEYLWHDGDSFCSCRSRPMPEHTTDDIWWCPACSGTISPQ